MKEDFKLIRKFPGMNLSIGTIFKYNEEIGGYTTGNKINTQWTYEYFKSGIPYFFTEIKKINREFLLYLGFEENYVSAEESGDADFTYWSLDINDPNSENKVQLISSHIDGQAIKIQKPYNLTVSLFDTNAGFCEYQDELLILINSLKKFENKS